MELWWLNFLLGKKKKITHSLYLFDIRSISTGGESILAIDWMLPSSWQGCKQATLYLLLEDIKFFKSLARKIFFQTCLHALLNSLLLSVCFFSCKLLRYTQHRRSHVKHIYPGLMFAIRHSNTVEAHVHMTTAFSYVSKILRRFFISSENECEAMHWMSDLFYINSIKGK